MVNETVERKFYLTPVNIEYIESEKKRHGQSYSYIVNTALDAVRTKKITDKAHEMMGPLGERIGLLEYNQKYMMTALNAIYRCANYTSRLINNGLPLVKINGNNIIKADKSMKDLARKKTMEDYSKLRTEMLGVENFLEDYQEDAEHEFFIYPETVEPADLDDKKKSWSDIYPFR